MSPGTPSPLFALFETAIGHCGIAWHAAVVRGIQLPEASEAATRAHMQRRFPAAVEALPDDLVVRAIVAVQSMLKGEVVDISFIPLDMTGVPLFHQRVYEVALRIPPGSTLTYGEIATQLGEPGAARAVGQALGRNPFAPVVPCHRVLAAGDKPGGFSAPGGLTTKYRMLEIERALSSTPDLFS